MDKSRNRGLDICRIIACALVIINHNNSKVMLQVIPGSMAWYVTVAVVYLTKIAVPVFFMITGYNLLHRIDDRRAYFARIARMSVILAVFTLAYFVWKCLIGVYDPGESGNPVAGFALGYIRVLFRDTVTDSYWYMYTYLGILIVLPVLQHIAAAAEGRTVFTVMMIMTVPLSVIPTAGLFVRGFNLSEYFVLPGVTTAVFYLFAGHLLYLYRDVNGGGLWLQCLIFAAGFALNMCFMHMEYNMSDGSAFLSQSEIHSPGIIACSVSFAMVLFRCGSLPPVIEKTVGVLAPLTFGVYLIGDFMCSTTHMVYYSLCAHMNRLAAVAIQDVAALAAAFVIVYLIRMIPAVKGWV